MPTRPRITARRSNNDNENYTSSEEIIKTNNDNSSSSQVISENQSERYQELKRKQQSIQKERAKREFEFEHALKQLKLCEEEASALGVNNIEELEELIKRKEQEEKEILDNFEKNLLKEEEALREIENNLNN